MSPPRTIPVFILSAPGDEQHRQALARQLAALEYGKLIKVWHEGKILGGAEGEVKERLREAEIILLIVTAAWPDLGDLLELAIEQQYLGARLIPVVAAPSEFNFAPFARFQPLPLDRRPVSERPNQDQGWYEVARGVRDVAVYLQKEPPALGAPRARAPEQRPKILFLAAQVTDAVLLRLGAEYGEIRKSLRDSEAGRGVELVFPGPVRPEELDRQILGERPTILHFSGHGAQSGSLAFANEDGATEPLTAERLGELFRILNEDGRIRCVVLNACYSRQNADVIRRYVDFVIGMTGAIRDEAAIRFSSAFYLALGHGESVKTAFELGCLRAGLASVIDSDRTRDLAPSDAAPEPTCPVLHCRAGVDPASVNLVR